MERVYPQKLELHRTDSKEESNGQSHYFIIVDERQTSAEKSKKWYRVINGNVSLEVKNFEFVTNYRQEEKLLRNREERTEQEVVESSSSVLINGTGVLTEGYRYINNNVRISHFGTSREHKEIKVTFHLDDDIVDDHFNIGGFQADHEIGTIEEFFVEFHLKEKTFESIKSEIFANHLERMEMTLGLHSGQNLYSEWTWFGGNSFGDLKLLGYENLKEITNSDDHDSEFLKSLPERTYSEELGKEFHFRLSKGSEESVPPKYDDSLKEKEHDQLWTDSDRNVYGNEKNDARWRLEISERLEATNFRLVLLILIGLLGIGVLLFN
jgi:hypothetical protein